MIDLAKCDFRRILIIKPSSPGDIIHALPVLHALRRRYPTAHIAWLVATPFVDLVAADPALNELIPFDRARFGHMWRSPAAIAEFWRFLNCLRRRQFDLVVDLQGLFRSGFLAWASRAPVRIGPAEARELAGVFYTHRIPPIPRDQHAADRIYRVGELLGFEDARMDFAISLTTDDHAAASALLGEALGSVDRPYAVLVPATRWETKCWPTQRYGELARRLREMHGLPSILVGGAGDAEMGRIAADASGGTAINVCGRTTLRSLAALLQHAAIIITADSTPMHMAAAFGRPLVAIFGPTNPRRTGPYGRPDAIVRLDLDCSPCYLRRLSQCPYQHACMQQLDVQRVAQAAATQLASTVRAPVAPD